MKPARPQPSSRAGPGRELIELRGRLAAAEETLRAIRGGEVDAVVVAGRHGDQVFTLEGADHAYRVLIESMSEGALTLTADKTILFANQRFAKMVRCPLEQVTGGSFRRFLSAEDRAMLKPLVKGGGKSGAKIQVRLIAGDGSQMPAQISLCPLAGTGFNRAAIGMVVTDLTAARRSEEMLRDLTHRVVQAQEAERGRVALELHDHITQLLCAILVRSQMLAERLPAGEGAARKEALKLSAQLGEAADEVERIARNLRPGVLDQLGITEVLRDTGAKFAKRTGLSLQVACDPLTARLPAAVELALYRITQEALKNVELHAHARQVTVQLRKSGDAVRLRIRDDGIGFDPNRYSGRRKGKGGLGLLGMRERATYVGGVLAVMSAGGAGTEIEVFIPLSKSPKPVA